MESGLISEKPALLSKLSKESGDKVRNSKGKALCKEH